MIKKHRLTPEKQAAIDELVRLGNIAVKAAQAESREMGVPNVYSVNGKLIYETATGDFFATDPGCSTRERSDSLKPSHERKSDS